MKTGIDNLFSSFVSGGQKAAGVMNILKIAIASTGIGLLIIAVGSLVAYFSSSAEGANKFKVIMAAVGAVVGTVVTVLKEVGEFLYKFGKAIVQIVGGTKSLKEGFNDVKDAASAAGKAIAGTVSGTGDRIKQAQALAEFEIKLQKDKRKNAEEDAENEKKIAELREKASEIIVKDVASAKAKNKLIQEAKDIQTAMSADEVEFAKKDLYVIQQKIKLNGETND